MRITQTMMMSNYKNSLDGSLGRLSDESDKIASQRQFSRASDDPVSAIKTLRAYRQLAVTDQYQQSEQEASTYMTSTESAVKNINSVLTSANSLILQAKNGTYSNGDATTQAQSIDSYQKEIVESLNQAYNGQYLFGGSTSGPQPFKIGTADDFSGPNADMDTSGGFTSDQVVGKLLYNVPNTNTYIPVSVINNSTDSGGGDPMYKYSVNNPDMKYTMPIDVGLGNKIDANGNVVQGTAFDASTSALDFLLQNVTSGSSENVVDALGDASAQLKAGDTSQLDSTLTMVQNTQDSEIKTTVDIGEKGKMLGFLDAKFTSDTTNLNSLLATVADVDITTESTKYEMDMMVYNASLSVGTNILQKSLIDFLK